MGTVISRFSDLSGRNLSSGRSSYLLSTTLNGVFVLDGMVV